MSGPHRYPTPAPAVSDYGVATQDFRASTAIMAILKPLAGSYRLFGQSWEPIYPFVGAGAPGSLFRTFLSTRQYKDVHSLFQTEKNYN